MRPLENTCFYSVSGAVCESFMWWGGRKRTAPKMPTARSALSVRKANTSVFMSAFRKQIQAFVATPFLFPMELLPNK